MKTYHATNNQELKEIIKGHGDYAGLFTSENIALTANGDYGDYIYTIEFDSICDKSDIEKYLENNPEFLVAHPEFIVDCDDAEQDDTYFANQKLRALIAIELGFDAVEENDGWLVVNGNVEFLGHRKSEEVETEIEENW
ncbi:hypothetical protein HCY65_11035 [Acinetobacter radioresistens]|uniref:hypothetical protein n=1 Tax=Acinetobacter radioresistens TaxID=40216 RepID=UPI0020051226|nr:hypothetical protein [Acinetobacter radioresistens]MCK4111588.1 hypothetical protein [Acinetobacter radioresistens]